MFKKKPAPEVLDKESTLKVLQCKQQEFVTKHTYASGKLQVRRDSSDIAPLLSRVSVTARPLSPPRSVSDFRSPSSGGVACRPWDWNCNCVCFV